MIRAYLREDRLGLSMAISFVMEPTDGTSPARILRFGQGWEDLPPDMAMVEPTLTLHDGEARALLDALANHYGGAEDTRALRRDYDAERRRVDDLTASLAAIAQSLSGQVG
ncbi:MAG: hypothetical protein JWN52_3589 [Actinomycetia bacterium]|nr:hypothetical protein [Actinomycetes bacterium]